MVRIHILDGAGSIGGTKLLLEDAGVRLLLDFGRNFKRVGDFFSYDPLSERYLWAWQRKFKEMRALGLLPEIPGGSTPYWAEKVERIEDLPNIPSPGVDAVIFSHAHIDHCGEIPYLNPRIPLYGSPVSLAFYQNEFVWKRVLVTGEVVNRKPNNELTRPMQPFTGGQELVFVPGGCEPSAGEPGGPAESPCVRVRSFPVDHSIPGSLAFIITTSEGKCIAYTGDFRSHGVAEDEGLTAAFFHHLSTSPPDLLISEGTNIDEYADEREEAPEGSWSVKAFVEEEMARAVERGAWVVCGVSMNNIPRIDSLFEAGQIFGRVLCIPVYLANLLLKLSVTGAFDETSVVNAIKKMIIYERYEGEFEERFEGTLDQYPKEIVGWDYFSADGGSAQAKTVILLWPADLHYLGDAGILPGSKFLHTTSDAFNEELEIQHSRLASWIRYLGMSYHHIHASGHIYAAQLLRLLREAHPRRLLPLHTDKPHLFRSALPPGEGEVILAQNGQVIEV